MVENDDVEIGGNKIKLYEENEQYEELVRKSGEKMKSLTKEQKEPLQIDVYYHEEEIDAGDINLNVNKNIDFNAPTVIHYYSNVKNQNKIKDQLKQLETNELYNNYKKYVEEEFNKYKLELEKKFNDKSEEDIIDDLTDENFQESYDYLLIKDGINPRCFKFDQQLIRDNFKEVKKFSKKNYQKIISNLTNHKMLLLISLILKRNKF